MCQSASTSFNGQFGAAVHLPSPSASRDDSTQTQHRFIARYIAKIRATLLPIATFSATRQSTGSTFTERGKLASR
ncbi:Uncharacterised protein [Vibrio cholerae]|nr:Uncharacterised protein [Vibrio cholerae]